MNNELMELFRWDWEGEFHQNFFVADREEFELKMYELLQEILTDDINLSDEESIEKYDIYSRSELLHDYNIYNFLRDKLSVIFEHVQVNLNTDYVNHLSKYYQINDKCKISVIEKCNKERTILAVEQEDAHK